MIAADELSFIRRFSSIAGRPSSWTGERTIWSSFACRRSLAPRDSSPSRRWSAGCGEVPPCALHGKVVEALTTNETTFFRDHHPFEALRSEVLPRLIAGRQRTRNLFVWSAACSTGQEPYSLAMLIREHFPELKDWDVRILATDFSQAALDRVNLGRYRQLEVNRGLPAPLLVKYFEREGAEWRVRSDLRSMVETKQLNLVEQWPSMPFVDVVMLRNVLIYFDVATKKKILGHVRKIMSSDGVLFLGAAETTLNIDDSFDRMTVGHAIRLSTESLARMKSDSSSAPDGRSSDERHSACPEEATTSARGDMAITEDILREVTQAAWDAMLGVPCGGPSSQS